MYHRWVVVIAVIGGGGGSVVVAGFVGVGVVTAVFMVSLFRSQKFTNFCINISVSVAIVC